MENNGPLKTFLHNNVKNIKDLLNSSDKNICLWVIDMQNDFIDAPFQDTTLFKDSDKDVIRLTHNNQPDGIFIGKLKSNPYKKVEIRSEDSFKNSESQINTGRFAVNEGIQCVKDVIHYINLLTDEYKDRLEKVIFSRDIHTTDEKNNANHCSFKSKSDIGFIDGIGFPAHCVNGTAGCQLHSKIKEACQNLDNDNNDNDNKDDKSLVVMKGCSEDYDSFGAFPYDCSEKGKAYSNIRQHNGCTQTCSGDNDSIDKNTGSFVLEKDEQFNLSVDLNKKRETIKDKIDSIGGDNMIHLVCGLAGDYCVRDTAINLKFAYPESTVAVIADATRYAALYDSVIVPELEEAERNTFLENTLHLKSFKDSIAGQPTYFLTPPDVMLYTYSNKMLPEEGVIFTMDDERKSNLNYTKPLDSSERPTQDPDNKYWCLSRYYYLLGKQMEYCSKNSKNSEKCYKKAKGFKDNKYKGKMTGRLSLNYHVVNENIKEPKKEIIQKRQRDAEKKHVEKMVTARANTKGGRRRRRKTKKRHNKKPKRKVTKKRHHKKTKKRKVRKTKKNKTRKR
jgi:nicotinamidase-related amidase